MDLYGVHLGEVIAWEDDSTKLELQKLLNNKEFPNGVRTQEGGGERGSLKYISIDELG